MVEETLTGTPPIIGGHSKSSNSPQAPVNRQTEVKNGANARTAAQPAGRKQRLKIHLAVGTVMAAVAIAGYVFFGPGVSTSTAEAANHQLVNVSAIGGLAVQPSNLNPGTAGGSTAYDMAALSAEMDAITSQINALKTGNISGGKANNLGESQPAQDLAGNGRSPSNDSFSGNSPDQIQATLEQMMVETHEMMAKMEAIQGQGNGASSSTGGGGGHH